MAPEDLGELRGLPVAHRGGHVLDRKRVVEQELGGARHPDALELAAEAGAAGLGERPLELSARGRDLMRHVRQGEVLVAITACNYRPRVPVQLTASLLR